MQYSVSICLTNQGTLSLGPTLKLYSNPISPLDPGVFIRDAATTSLTTNCPFIFSVPVGTQTVRIFDPVSFCYVDIAVSDSNVCVTCNLSLAGVVNNLISMINVGELTGTCDNSITDYVIEWYGPNSTTNLSFTSGKGTLFTGQYQYIHPITSSNSPFLNDGTYISRIKKVELNGRKYSSIPEVGSIFSCGLTGCSTPIAVVPYSCLNPSPDPGNPLYQHYRQFIFTNPNTPPNSLEATFKLNAGQTSFIWQFEGQTIDDTLKLTFIGSAYSGPILLEEITVGNGAPPTNYTPSTWPKVFQGFSFKKITMLSNLTVNSGDSIIMNVKPNPINNSTNWKFWFGCPPSLSISKTCLDSYRNKPYKIKSSTIIVTPEPCNKYRMSFSVIGCTTNDNISFFGSNLMKLQQTVLGETTVSTQNSDGLKPLTSGYLYPSYTDVLTSTDNSSPTCVSSPNQQIKVVKNTTTRIEIFFTHQSDLNNYITYLNARKATLVTAGYGGPYNSNNTTIGYYKFIRLRAYNGTFDCGDGPAPTQIELAFHYSAAISTGASTVYPGFGWQMFITTPLITWNYTCTSCNSPTCANSQTETNNSNNTRNNITVNQNATGFHYNNPFFYISGLLQNTFAERKSLSMGNPTVSVRWSYSNNTYPATGSGPYTLVPSLSATTWDWENHTYKDGDEYKQRVYDYVAEIITFTPLVYVIKAAPIVNFNSTGNYITVWSSNNSVPPNFTYIDPS